MGIEVRHPTPDEGREIADVLSTAFLDRPDLDAVGASIGRNWDMDRGWIAVEDGRICGTFATWGTEITVPGLGLVPASAVSAVTVLPTHRRRGILTRMAAADRDATRERGEQVSLLYAAESAIYGRFGYGPATRWANWVVDRRRSPFREPADGRVELVTATAQTQATMLSVFERWRAARPGEIRRRPMSWARRLGLEAEPWGETWKGWLAFHRDPAGEVDGYVRWRTKSVETAGENHNELILGDVVGLTPVAEGALWSFLGSIDLIHAIRAEGFSPADPVAWRLVDPRAARLEAVSDALWVRPWDVAVVLAARTYERADSLVLEVLDDEADGGRVRVLLDGGPDGSRCVPTRRSPDLTLPVRALGSVYLGAHDLRDVALSVPVEEHREGAIARAAELFRTTREPYCSTFF